MRRHAALSLALAVTVGGLLLTALPTQAAAPDDRGTAWTGGPDLLRAPAPGSATLAASGPFRAEPVLVSGTTLIRSGELLSTDFLYDDRGPDTTPVPLAPPLRPDDRTSPLTPGTGDLVYPTAEVHASNSADLVQLRMIIDGGDLVVRAALNTLEQAGTAALAVGFDLDEDDDVADWGHGLGELGPTGVDTVLWSDGVQARVGDVAVPTTTDVDKHHITTRVPLALLGGATGTTEVFAVVGLSDGAEAFRPAAAQPTQDAPGGDPLGSAPPVFNVAFRDMEQEPFGSLDDPDAAGTRGASFGQWRGHAQAKALAARDLSAFSAELPWALLRRGGDAGTVPTTGYLNRILVSSRSFGAGVRAEFPQYLGQLQPYAVFVPEDLPARAPMLLWMHSSSSAHNQ